MRSRESEDVEKADEWEAGRAGDGGGSGGFALGNGPSEAPGVEEEGEKGEEEKGKEKSIEALGNGNGEMEK